MINDTLPNLTDATRCRLIQPPLVLQCVNRTTLPPAQLPLLPGLQQIPAPPFRQNNFHLQKN